MSCKKWIVFVVFLFAVVISILSPENMNQQQSLTFGLVLVVLSLWGTNIIPNYLTSLAFFAFLLIFKIAPPAAVFSGFSSAAIWLVFSGFIIAIAIKNVGLSGYISQLFERYFSKSYLVLVSGVMLFTMALGFLMPSSLGRAVLMVPIGMALADQVGFVPGSKGRTGIALALTLGCHVPGFAILPANVPNLVLTGAAQTLYGLNLTYANYLLLHYPILGIVKSALITGLIVLFFPDKPVYQTCLHSEKIHSDSGTKTERRKRYWISGILIMTLLFWMTDSIHNISPAWIGLVASVVLMLPGLKLVEPGQFQKNINFGLLLFIAGILGLSAVMKHTGLGNVIAQWLIHVLPLAKGADFTNFMSLCVMSFVTGIVTTLPGVPAVLTPMAHQLSDITGLSVSAVLMTQVIGFSTILFPFQSGPMTVGMQLSNERLGYAMKITVPLTIITLCILAPLDYVWWEYLGMFQ
ncbi:SLC13 family permease [Vibrio salinus]|uniref:SLC13 family permease n=1 Tax=Vibrio salinus TaxID=2899784 RepID=UPI001E378B92|nr:SLC13 family permease [Vibrio salinus]MCE0494895.1 anion permease [Vibrio salinus]